MKLKGIVFEDFVNYKKPCMTLEFPCCSFKCDVENGAPVCQNSGLATAPNIDISVYDIVMAYVSNPITEAMCFQGLEPLDSFEDVISIVDELRINCGNRDDIVIYTGYREDEIEDKLSKLAHYDNIVVKFGRFISNRPHIYDEVLGVELSSDNQYARRL